MIKIPNIEREDIFEEFSVRSLYFENVSFSHKTSKLAPHRQIYLISW